MSDTSISRTGPSDRGILTLAFGRKVYVDMAVGLARSLKRHSPRLPRAIVTDSKDARLPRLFDRLIPWRADLGSGVEQKLSLDLYTPFRSTLYIDSDCLVFRDFESTWRAIESPAGFGALAGAWLGPGANHPHVHDLGALLEAAGVSRLASFNSGALWWSTGGARVFEEARRLLPAVASQMKRFKASSLNDEVVLGLAMERLGVAYAAPREMHMEPTLDASDLRQINVLNGRSDFELGGRRFAPEIIHFNIAGQLAPAYHRELWRLALAERSRGLAWAAPLFNLPRAANAFARRLMPLSAKRFLRRLFPRFASPPVS